MNMKPYSHNQNSRSTLIIIENSSFLCDPRVQNEAFSLRDAGWNVSVLCPLFKEYEGDNVTSANFWHQHNREGIFVYYYPSSYRGDGFFSYLIEYLAAFYWIALRSWHIWLKTHFKVIHLCNPPDIFFPIAFIYRLLGVRVLFDHHDLFPELILVRFHGLRGKMLYWFSRLVEFWTFRVAHMVITTNRSFQQIAETRGMYPSERIFNVRNGPRLAEFVPLAPEPALKCGFAKMVVYAGVMGYQDGVLEYLESIRYLIQDQNRRDILFVLLGDGAVRSIACEHVKAWKTDCVQLPGMIRDKHLLRQYLSTADILVAPEPYNELNEHSTFIKVAEYMAMGKPIIAYDLKETRYTAQESALYVPHDDVNAFAEAILKLVDQPELCTKLTNFAKKRIAEVSWESQQPLLLSAYEAALRIK
ncbi:MAG: glycosyltransferase family 4 protein [Chloroflexi bacterium]|nr:glycosyltransferase family 4 protein [Chloroflexota bacterium]